MPPFKATEVYFIEQTVEKTNFYFAERKDLREENVFDLLIRSFKIAGEVLEKFLSITVIKIEDLAYCRFFRQKLQQNSISSLVANFFQFFRGFISPKMK